MSSPPAPALPRQPSARATLIFSSLGHAYMHLLVAYFFVMVLPLERDWQTPYHELIELWTVGAALVGLLALPAGWLADRWSAPGMMVVFFVGLGAGALVCASATSPTSMWIGLCLIGSFASIYHPVGIPWLVRTSTVNRGKALGVNGIFGSVGVAGAGVVAGTLIDLAGWRVAFIVPGIVAVATGLAMLACLKLGLVVDVTPADTTERATSGARGARAFMVLVLTMIAGAIVYQATQVALPKLFALRLPSFAGNGTLGVGALVALVYGAAAVTQVTAGHLADRYPLKPVYLWAFLLQVPCLAIMAFSDGTLLVLAAAAAVIFNVGSLPAENLLLAAATPRGRHGLAFGIKFVLAFGAGPLAIQLVAWLAGSAAGFSSVFVTLAFCATAGTAAALVLPALQAPDTTPASPVVAEPAVSPTAAAL